MVPIKTIHENKLEEDTMAKKQKSPEAEPKQSKTQPLRGW